MGYGGYAPIDIGVGYGEQVERQYGGIIPLTGTYQLEAGELVKTRLMLGDLIGLNRRLVEGRVPVMPIG